MTKNDNLDRTSWVSVKERLPEGGQRVLGWYVPRLRVVSPLAEPAFWDGDGFHDDDGFGLADVTHWMPLPEAPEITS